MASYLLVINLLTEENVDYNMQKGGNMRRFALLFIILSGTAFAKVWVIDTTGAEGDSLQKAINSAWADPGIDTVLVKNGTYHLFINDTVGLIMRDSTVLMSENGAEKCTLTAVSEDGTDTAWHVIYCSGWDTASHAALIRGFTIKDGKAKGPSPHIMGGGIFIKSASPRIDSCIITGNYADYRGGGIEILYHSSPVLSGNIIENNYAEDYGGGISIFNYSSPTLINNIIKNDSTDYGGGIYIDFYSSPILSHNIITDNSAKQGGGVYIARSSATLIGNTIANNLASDRGGGCFIAGQSSATLKGNTIKNNRTPFGGGIYIAGASSPTLENNIIVNNHAYYDGGGIHIYHSSPTLLGAVIIDNYAGRNGSGIYIRYNSSAKLTKCVLGMNKSKYGGAIYDTLNSKVIIDSSFIVDNGDYLRSAGLAYITADADSGVTFKLTYSHIYYNTFQPDTEIKNLSSVTMNLENNFWWDTTDADISAKIAGLNDHTPWFNDFIPGVPGEPVSIDSLKNYDKGFSQVIDSLGKEDTLYIRVYGQDRDAHIHEIAVVIIKSSVYPQGIAVGLVETDTNSGVYEGMAYILESTGNENIRTDDINQIIRVDPIGDEITLQSNIDATKKFFVKYKGGPQPNIVLSDTLHDFGACSPCDTIDWKMWIENAGSEILSIDSVKVNLPFELISPSLPQTTPPGDSTGFTIRFNPQDTGNFYDTMKIYSNDPDEPVAKIYLSGRAVIPNIVLSDTVHDFGSCSQYDTIDWQMWVSNAGDGVLVIDSVELEPPFALVLPALPETISPGDSTGFTIRFNPQDTGSFSDTMEIYSNDPDEPVAKIYLSGKALAPDIALSNTIHDFGACSPYDTIEWQMWVSNVGNADLIIDSVELFSPFALVSPALPETILPDDSTEFTIRFNPQDTGNFSDTMKIYSNDPDEPIAKVLLLASCVGLQEVPPRIFKVSNYPNPFSNFTKIKYQLPKEVKVKIEIIDITGRSIKVLVDEKKKPGFYSVTWHGKDTKGRNVPPGIYFYLVKAGRNKVVKKIIKLR